MSRRLDDLSDRFRPMAVLFLARLMEQGIPVCVVDTLRTTAEQAVNVAKGVSWTMASKHLTGDAIDVCPYAIFDLHGPDKLQWDASDPIWARIATIGESCGMVAGYRWKVKDCGHFEYRSPTPVSGAAV